MITVINDSKSRISKVAPLFDDVATKVTCE